MKIAILYSGLSGYSAACQRALKELFDVELFVSHWPTSAEAPFDDHIYNHIDKRVIKQDLSADELLKQIIDFGPSAVLVSGWMDKDYLRVSRRLKARNILVIASSDTQWKNSFRQKIAGKMAPWYLHTAFDILWVTGERQRLLAQHLGYDTENCWTGFYSCDWHFFQNSVYENRQQAFLYVGRLIERKGIDVLVKAYESYRIQSEAPWDLWVAGTGPLEESIKDKEGIKNLGFVQPEDLPKLLNESGCFVLPSYVEPWGVVLQEAAAAGLPLLCSDACGAGVHLVRDYFNGFVFQAGHSAQLTKNLMQIENMSENELKRMSRGSYELSKQYTPHLWAKTLINGIKSRGC